MLENTIGGRISEDGRGLGPSLRRRCGSLLTRHLLVRWRTFGRLVLLLVAAAAAAAQSQPAEDHWTGHGEDRAAAEWGSAEARIERDRRFFEPAAEDRGPLMPGEEERLMAFARQRFPIMHRLMSEAQQRNPRAFARRFETELAPRLRHVQRIYAESEELGELLRRHVESMFLLQRAQRMASSKQTPRAMRARLSQEMRQHLRTVVDLEPGLLETRARQFASDRSDWIEKRLGRALSGAATAEEQTPEMSEALRAYHASGDAAAREAARVRLRDLIAAQLDLEIGLMRTRAQQLRQRSDEEFDRRWRNIQERIAAAEAEKDRKPGRPDSPPAGRPRASSPGP